MFDQEFVDMVNRAKGMTQEEFDQLYPMQPMGPPPGTSVMPPPANATPYSPADQNRFLDNYQAPPPVSPYADPNAPMQEASMGGGGLLDSRAMGLGGGSQGQGGGFLSGLFGGGGDRPSGGKDWGSMLMALGGGIAQGAQFGGGGWGGGLGAGFQGAAAVNQRQKAMDQQLAMQQAEQAQALQIAKMRAQGEDQYFGTPVPFQKPDGTWGVGLPSKDGGFKALEVPGTYMPPTQQLDTGLGFQGVSKYGGTPVGGQTPKNVAGEAAAKESGVSQGKAEANMPIVENATRRIIETLEDIEKSPGLDRATGPLQSQLPTISGEVADVEAKVEQAASGTFLQMYDQIRGAGQITEAEGAKASGALARVGNLKQSDEGYTQAVKEAKFEVFELMNVTRRKAGLDPLPNPYTDKGKKGSTAGTTRSGIKWKVEP
jgi:hypothetical protein